MLSPVTITTPIPAFSHIFKAKGTLLRTGSLIPKIHNSMVFFEIPIVRRPVLARELMYPVYISRSSGVSSIVPSATATESHILRIISDAPFVYLHPSTSVDDILVLDENGVIAVILDLYSARMFSYDLP
ncbi:hypothetical protein AR158_c787R [Paramecium bursaria Chlorella virus AR158]|uniref:hypothetical protein n=1 Tax=Paramecium bursaria Chlorella virus AR158 TaxID=380598 RepID=UPI00015AA8FE|nr:hypothetical protein AR158_c787R [Paramecium bursaria Chlorella virus AR158]ABU44332.1 hypothetical protein AR158_c787R [Paramecium bursaria Chlorella virus AR158]